MESSGALNPQGDFNNIPDELPIKVKKTVSTRCIQDYKFEKYKFVPISTFLRDIRKKL